MAQPASNFPQRMQAALYYARKARLKRRAAQVAAEDPEITAARDAAFQANLASQNAKSGS